MYSDLHEVWFWLFLLSYSLQSWEFKEMERIFVVCFIILIGMQKSCLQCLGKQQISTDRLYDIDLINLLYGSKTGCQ